MEREQGGESITFHVGASERFDELGAELLQTVSSFGPTTPRQPLKTKLHPVASISAEIKWQEHSVNGLGEETGRFWDSNGYRVGWDGPEFDKIANLARRFESSHPVKGRVSFKFLLDEVFTWLRETLEKNRAEGLTEYIAMRCSQEIRKYEIWIPIFRTFSSQDFSIGEVQFRTVSKELLDRYYGRAPADQLNKPEVAIVVNRERASLQGSIAACMKVKAEFQKATDIARDTAEEAVGLLRVISSVNWTSKLVSHCLPLGRANTRAATELLIENGELKEIHKTAIDIGPPGWDIDESRQAWKGLLEQIGLLASTRNSTKFKAALYDSLVMFSRSSAESNLANRIVFVLAGLESMLLRDANEPIQSNLGERMAFLIATEPQERVDVSKMVKDFYQIRSAFVHHGQEIREDDRVLVDRFLFAAWFCFVRLLARMDEFNSREQMFDFLERIKFS